MVQYFWIWLNKQDFVPHNKSGDLVSKWEENIRLFKVFFSEKDEADIN